MFFPPFLQIYGEQWTDVLTISRLATSKAPELGTETETELEATQRTVTADTNIQQTRTEEMHLPGLNGTLVESVDRSVYWQTALGEVYEGPFLRFRQHDEN